MSVEVQIAKVACAGIVGTLGVYWGKSVADKYLEIKALSTMPESYWATKQKEADMEIKKVEIHEAEETKRKQEELNYKREKDEKDRQHRLEVMEKEKGYPDSYWIYKTEKVRNEGLVKTEVKKQEASVEKQKTIMNVVSTGVDMLTRRYL